MHRKAFLLLTAIQIIACLSACALHKPAEETVPWISSGTTGTTLESGQNKADFTETQIVSVVKNEKIGERSLQIDAEVVIPELHTMKNIKLGANTEKRNLLAEDWILSKAPGTKSVSSAFQTVWEVEAEGTFHETLCIDTDSIRVNYLNVANDINSDIMEEEEMSSFFPHYITQEHPPLLNISAEEAAEEASQILARYSCFTYSPWNVVAYNAEKEGGSGAYRMELQPLYNGVPVFDQYRPDRDEHLQSAKITTWMSAGGMFSFQGNLLLKEIGKTDIAQALSLECAVEKLIEDFSIYAIGKSVYVAGICAGFYLQGTSADNTCTLIPGWAFECRDSAEKSSHERQYTCFYDFESGKLHLLEY